MIEVLFGESEAGSMKYAKMKHFIEGESDEVVCLGFMLDIGDIQEAVDSPYRQALIFDMLTQSGWTHQPEVLQELKYAGQKYVSDLERLEDYLAQGESIRIWYSESPYALCGFYWLCDLFRAYQGCIYAVKLPQYVCKENKRVTVYQNWGEVDAVSFRDFLSYEIQLSTLEVKMFADKWRDLVADHTLLRACINGKLVGLPENFYDDFIRKELGQQPIKEIKVIGNMLGKYQLGVSDSWYASRIEAMIKAGKICVIHDSDKKYTRIISCV